jgi:hypothetical protein
MGERVEWAYKIDGRMVKNEKIIKYLGIEGKEDHILREGYGK